MRTSDSSAVKSAGRTLDLLELFAGDGAPRAFRDIGAALDIPASSLSQLLATLAERGYVEHLGLRGGYRAGPALEALLARRGRGRSLIDLARPVLADLRDALGESVGLNVPKGDETEVVAAEHAEGALIYRIQVGATAPLYAVAAGKAILAALPDAELAAYAARAVFEPRTPATIRTGVQLMREVKRIRASGFAHSMQEAAAGVVGVARAILNDGRPVGALTVGLPAARYDAAADARIREALLVAARRLEAALTRP